MTKPSKRARKPRHSSAPSKRQASDSKRPGRGCGKQPQPRPLHRGASTGLQFFRHDKHADELEYSKDGEGITKLRTTVIDEKEPHLLEYISSEWESAKQGRSRHFFQVPEEDGKIQSVGVTMQYLRALHKLRQRQAAEQGQGSPVKTRVTLPQDAETFKPQLSSAAEEGEGMENWDMKPEDEASEEKYDFEAEDEGSPPRKDGICEPAASFLGADEQQDKEAEHDSAKQMGG